MKSAIVVVLAASVVGCSSATGPSVGSPAAASSLPVSRVAASCVTSNRELIQEFTDALNEADPGTATAEDLENFSQTIERVAYSLALNAGSMEQELEERGPVRDGDECLYGAALGLEVIADSLPPGESLDDTIDRLLRHYRSLLMYYPDSEWADEAQASIDEWT